MGPSGPRCHESFTAGPLRARQDSLGTRERPSGCNDHVCPGFYNPTTIFSPKNNRSSRFALRVMKTTTTPALLSVSGGPSSEGGGGGTAPAALLEKHRGHESHPPSASQREMLARLRSAVLKSTSDPDRVCHRLPGPCALGGVVVVDSGGHFWAKSSSMRSGHNQLVTTPAGAGAGAHSREKRAVRTPPLLVKLYSSPSSKR